MASKINPLPDLSADNYVIGDTVEVVTKQNSINAKIDNLALQINGTVDGINADVDIVNAAAASLNVDQIVYTPGSGQPNEAGTVYGYDVGSDAEQVPRNSDLDERFAGRVAVGSVGDEEVYTGTGLQSVAQALNERVSARSPISFGAVGDGVSDDTQAVIDCIESGGLIDWGDSNKNYRITTPINVSVSHQLNFMGNGAGIFCDFPEYSPHAVDITVNTTWKHDVSGFPEIDCNGSCPVGLHIYSPIPTGGGFPIGYPSIVGKGLKVKNGYRQNNEFSGSHGIWIEGAWRTVHLKSPVVQAPRCADSALQPGVSGSFGIVVYREGSSSLATPFLTIIENPEVYFVAHIDDTSHVDHDAIIVGTSINSNAPGGATPHTFFCENVLSSNIRNRTLKSQATQGSISGVKVRRFSDIGGPVKTGNAEIDSQYSGISVDDVECFYEGSVPTSVVQCTTRSPGYFTAPPNIGGVRVTNISGEELGSVIDAIYTGIVLTNNPTANVGNINVVGPLRWVFRIFGNASAPGKSLLNAVNVTASPSQSWVVFNEDAGEILVTLVSNHNLNPSMTMNVDDSAVNSETVSRVVNFIGCSGFDDANRIANDFFPPATRVNSLAANSVGRSAIKRPNAVTLADGDTYLLPATSSASVASGHLEVAVGRNSRASQAEFVYDSAGLTLKGEYSTEWSAGERSEPASGPYRAWIDSSTNRVCISNRSGVERVFSFWAFG